MPENKVTVVLSAKDQASKVFDKLGGALKTSVVAGAAAAAAAMAALTVELVFATKAANVQEESEVKLAVALRSIGRASRETLDGLKAHAAALQNVTKFGDETIIGVQALLVQLGRLADTEQIERATEATLQFAAATGTDLQAAALLVAKAAQGQTASLSRYGLILREGIPPQEKFNELLNLMEQNFGGTAEALGATFQGRLQQATNAFGDLQEEVGFTITQSPAIQEALKITAEAFAALGEFIESNRGAIQTWITKGLLVVLDASAEASDALADFAVIVEEVTGSIEANINETALLQGALAGATGQLKPLLTLLGVYADTIREDRKESGELTDDTVTLSETLDGLTESIRAGAARIRELSSDSKDATDSLLGLGEGAETAAQANIDLLDALSALDVIVPAVPGPSKADIEQTAKALEAQKDALQEIEQLNFEASESKRAILERELDDQLAHFESLLEFEGISAEERLALKEFEAERRREIDVEIDEHNRELAVQNLNFGQEIAIESVGTLTEGLATFVEAAILNAENLKDVGEGVMKSLVGSVVGGLAKIASQFLINAILHRIAKKQEGASALSANLAAVFSGAFASTAAIPIVGPALAPGVAAASLTAATVGSTSAGAAGAGIGSGLVAQEGGFVPMLPGAVPGRDSVLAALTPGELITPEPFANEVLRAQRFQEGGLVGGAAPEGAAPGGPMQMMLSFVGVDPAQMVEIADALSEAVERFDARLVSSEVRA
jgi:hypothetical protein